MCTSCDANGTSDAHTHTKDEMVPVNIDNKVNGVSGQNGTTNGTTNGIVNGNGSAPTANGAPSAQPAQQRNPYAPRYADFLSNVSNFSIIESTLRGMRAFLYADDALLSSLLSV